MVIDIHMMQMEASTRGQMKNRDVVLKGSHKSIEQGKDDDLVEIYKKHHEIVRSFFDGGELDLNDYRPVFFEVDLEDRNLIHIAIIRLKNDYKKMGAKWPGTPAKALDLVEGLVVEDPKLLTRPDCQKNIPLLEAAEAPIELFSRVINLVVPDAVRQALQNTCQQDANTCPLKQVNERRRDQCLKKPDPYDSEGDVDLSKAKESPLCCCLHNQVDVSQLLERDTALRRTLSENLGPCLQLLIDTTNFDLDLKGGFHAVSDDSFNGLLQLCSPDVFMSTSGNGYTPLQMAVRLYNTKASSIDHDRLFRIIAALVNIAPSSIHVKAGFKADNDKGKTVYDLLKDLQQVDLTDDISREYDSELETEMTQRLERFIYTHLGIPQCFGAGYTARVFQVSPIFNHSKFRYAQGFFESELIEELAARCPKLKAEDIKIDYCTLPTVQDSDDKMYIYKDPRNDGKSPSETMQKPNEWIERLTGFKSLMHSILSRTKMPPVRIALIDDGASLNNLHGTQKGISFRPDNQEWWVEPCSHGSQMAYCIRKICPMAELYVARMDDSGINEKKEKFTLSSACQALQWAVSMGVDIISMSWSFEIKEDGTDTHSDTFVRLVKDIVASKKIVLFGSVMDKGPVFETINYAPVGLNGVIKIASSNIYGQLSQENEFSGPEFLLPGEELAMPTKEIVNGSSFSTAFAAGLAGLVLCCLEAHIEIDDPDAMYDSRDERIERLHKARTCEGMKTIFKILSGATPEDKQKKGFFIRPYLVFGGRFGDSGEDMAKAIKRISSEILPTKTMRTLSY